jgi:hypothetical protein
VSAEISYLYTRLEPRDCSIPIEAVLDFAGDSMGGGDRYGAGIVASGGTGFEVESILDTRRGVGGRCSKSLICVEAAG